MARIWFDSEIKQMKQREKAKGKIEERRRIVDWIKSKAIRAIKPNKDVTLLYWIWDEDFEKLKRGL